MNSRSFNASGNPDLECIQVDDPVFSEETWFNIDEGASFSDNCETFGLTYVPDDNFEQALIDLGLNDVLDNYVSTDSINTITLLDISRLEISDLTGIEDFTALTNLVCHNNNLTALSVSANKELTHLSCFNNSINDLDVSSNTSLTNLYCQGNNLVRLNLKNGNNINMKRFTAKRNPTLTCIQVDDVSYMLMSTNFLIPDHASYNTDCGYPEALAKGSSDKKSTSTNDLQDVKGSQEFDYSLYPNPVSNILNIKSNGPIDAITVVNIQGAIVLSSTKSQIDFSNLPPSVYIVQIISGNQRTYKKVVKK